MSASMFAALFESGGSENSSRENCDEGDLRLPPLGLYGFTTTGMSLQVSGDGQSVFVISGNVENLEPSRTCPKCGQIMHIHGSYPVNLRHLPFGGTYSKLHFLFSRLLCPRCRHTEMQQIPFKSDEHRITRPLRTYIESLLARARYTHKEIAVMAGVNRYIVRDIDRKRPDREDTGENGDPAKESVGEPVPFLGISEFLFQRGKRYTTHIVDQQTGAVLWLAWGRKRQVFHDFVDHCGPLWMEGVQAVVCDMTQDFEEAFLEKCRHIHFFCMNEKKA